METIGVGIVGCGFVGRGAHVPAFTDIDGARLVAVADLDPKRLGKAAAKYEIESTYQDHADLIADPAVNAVVVAVPTPLHARVAMAAIKAGKHVLCEMPLAANLDEADEMIDVARTQGALLMPSLTFRFTPNLVKAKEMIAQGVHGDTTPGRHTALFEDETVGVILTEDCLMRPLKSISGLIGLAPADEIEAHGSPCDRCELYSCAMRR